MPKQLHCSWSNNYAEQLHVLISDRGRRVHQHSLQILKVGLMSNSKPRQPLSLLRGPLACRARHTARGSAGSPGGVWVSELVLKEEQSQPWGWVLPSPCSRAPGGHTEEETKGYQYGRGKSCQYRGDKSLWETPASPPPPEICHLAKHTLWRELGRLNTSDEVKV